jgi:hypothetical protein
MQLVGFTVIEVAGDRGILNLARECQKLFASSRVCTAGEIAGSVIVPEIAVCGHAWIQGDGATLLGLRTVANCANWTSASAQDLGLTVTIGTESECYGGFITRRCNELHPVACCAYVEKTQTAP